MRKAACFVAKVLGVLICGAALRAETDSPRLAQATPAPSGQQLVGLEA